VRIAINQRVNCMEDKESYLQKLAVQLSKWGTEIDELKAKVGKTKTESKSDLLKQIDELRVRTETARENLIQVFISIRNNIR
jgi:hypothetical protein